MGSDFYCGMCDMHFFNADVNKHVETHKEHGDRCILFYGSGSVVEYDCRDGDGPKILVRKLVRKREEENMTNERLKQLHKLTGDLSKAMIDNDLWSSEAVEYAHDVRALIDAEAKRQSSTTDDVIDIDVLQGTEG